MVLLGGQVLNIKFVIYLNHKWVYFKQQANMKVVADYYKINKLVAKNNACIYECTFSNELLKFINEIEKLKIKWNL